MSDTKDTTKETTTTTTTPSTTTTTTTLPTLSNPFAAAGTAFSFPAAVSLSTPAPAAAASSATADDAEGDDNPEEENTTEYTPVIKLAEQQLPTGEEDDEIVYKQRCALYRFTNGEWKERGRGDVKLMKNKKSGVVRVLMRQDVTLKIATNQIVHPEMELRANAGSDRSWVWRGRDFSDETPVDVTFAIRFKDSDIANEYKKAYDDARKANETALKATAAAASSS